MTRRHRGVVPGKGRGRGFEVRRKPPRYHQVTTSFLGYFRHSSSTLPFLGRVRAPTSLRGSAHFYARKSSTSWCSRLDLYSRPHRASTLVIFFKKINSRPHVFNHRNHILLAEKTPRLSFTWINSPAVLCPARFHMYHLRLARCGGSNIHGDIPRRKRSCKVYSAQAC